MYEFSLPCYEMSGTLFIAQKKNMSGTLSFAWD